MTTCSKPISSLEFARHQQREAAERYIEDGHPLAELGMGDWFAEEFLITQEEACRNNGPNSIA